MNTTQSTYQTAGPTGIPPQSAGSDRSLRTFRRSREHRVLGGVCGGLAEALRIDVALVRVLAVVLAIVTNGVGALAYLAAWALIPEEGTDTAPLVASLRR